MSVTKQMANGCHEPPGHLYDGEGKKMRHKNAEKEAFTRGSEYDMSDAISLIQRDRHFDID